MSNPKAKTAVEVEVLDETETPNSILRTLPKGNFLVVPKNADGSLASSLVGAPRYSIMSLTSLVAAAITAVAAIYAVVRNGTRHRVFSGDINLAEISDLAFKSFASFGELIKRAFNGELVLGTVPGQAEVLGSPGQIAIAVNFSNGTTSDVVRFGASNGEENSISNAQLQIPDITNWLSNFGTVSVDDSDVAANGGMGGNVIFTVALTVEISSIEEFSSGAVFPRTGFTLGTPATGAQSPNAILLDQFSGEVKFVRIAAIPVGEEVGSVTRGVAPDENGAFE